jgi:diguanylate cyclase (GGDEF)-like protein
MKVRSVQFKFLITIISAILAISILIGGFSIYEVDNYIQANTKEFLNTTCSNETAQVNDIFGDIEKSVKIMESYVLSLFNGSTAMTDRDEQKRILDLSSEMFVDIATNTDGAVAYYMRLAPEISDSKTGIFFTKMNGGEEYIDLGPTDLSLYDRDDTEHVGWYWEPYEAGHPIWMAPYYNQNNDILMISYVIPLYSENRFIGIVGMDFDYTILTENIHRIKVFENGFAHLELDGVVIHTGNELEENIPAEDFEEKYLHAYGELANGMTLVLSASYSDIRQTRHEIAYKILISVIVLMLAFSVFVFLIVKKIVKPLRKLTDASIKLANGDYNVEIEYSNTLEIQLLSKAFENMTLNLREHEKLQHFLAYRDSLTGLRNTTSYKKWEADFDQKAHEGNHAFGVVMLDLNYLKETNDTYGHDVGNKLIVGAAQIISDTFKRSPVFRIGGDEFLAILQNRDLEEREELFAKFRTACANSFVEAENEKIPISIAIGFSMFDPDTDTQFADVFNRADDQMYQNKKHMKMAK